MQFSTLWYNYCMKSKRKKGWNKSIFLSAGLFILAFITLAIFIKHTINSNKQKNQTVMNNSTAPVSTAVPKVAVQTADWKTYTITDDPTFHFKLPHNWKYLEFWKPMPPNAYGIQSPDFRSEKGSFRIKSGSIIEIVSDELRGPHVPTEEVAAQIAGNGDAKILGYYQTPDFKAIKFTHHCCEDYNTTYEFLFLRNGREYTLAQHYVRNGINPYPDLLDQIVSTITFTKGN